MGTVNKINSNSTGLRFAEELTPGNLVSDVVGDGDRSVDIWYPLEPNEYSDFGGEVTTVARQPINASRQRKKGLAVDLDASGGFQTDLTQQNILRQLRGFTFSDWREKADTRGFSREVTYDPDDGSEDLANIALSVGSISSNEIIFAASGDPSSTNSGRTRAFAANMLVYVSGMSIAGNNGLKSVASVDADGITVDQTLTNTASAEPDARIVEVGWEFAEGDLEVDASSGFPKLVTTTQDLRDLGLIPGEWIFIGGDATGNQFATAANNGFKRIRSIAENEIVLDKSTLAMVTDDGTGKTMRVFYGRCIKNEASPSLQKTFTIQMERTLGFSERATPGNEQADYVAGCFANEFNFNVTTADKITMDLGYVGTNSFTLNENTGGVTLRSKEAVDDGSAANAPAIQEADPFNTSSDIKRIALTVLEDGTENPTPLFAYIQELTLTINNNATPDKAVGVFGAFDVTVGTFEVSANMTAYFNDTAAIQAVRNTSDVSLDMHFVKSNAGISFDLPLVTLGDGRPNVALNEPVTIPITNDAVTGAKISQNLDHTILFVFWDYLPALAG